MIPDYTPRDSTDFLAIHCSDTPASMDIGEAEIRQWHLEQKWIDIGYNIVIRLSGVVEIGRPLDYRGAHVAGYNHCALGICLVGGRAQESNKPEDNFTAGQRAALLDVLKFCWRYAPGAEARGHGSFPGTDKACPVLDVTAFLALNHLTPTGGFSP